MKTIILAALLTVSLPSQAYVIDTLVGSADLGNSGDEAERQALADLLGIPLGDVVLTDKVDTPAAAAGPFQNPGTTDEWYLDVTPEEPGFFALKFGTGGLPVTSDTFYFENIADLTKLAWADWQVDGITGDPSCGGRCNIDRLSHYTLLDIGDGDGEDPPDVVPVPAPLAMIGLGIALLAGGRRLCR